MERVRSRKRDVIRKLKGLGRQWYIDMTKGNFPSVTFPSRSTDNILYDEQLKQYVLGDKRVLRSARNIRHLRPFSHLVWAAFFIDSLVKSGKTSTLRDVYYSAQAYGIKFKDQYESNEIITDLETVISHPREDFNVFPEQRSAIFGDLTIEYTTRGYEGKRLNLTIHPDGVMIGPALAASEFVKTTADKVIVVEKGALFTRLIEEGAHKRFNALIVHTAGQAPRATRALIRRLNKELDLPVTIFSVDREEGLLLRKNGVLRSVRIGEFVDHEMGRNDPEVLASAVTCERCPVAEARSIAVSQTGEVFEGDVVYALRHRVSGPLYEVIAKGGYRVRLTGSHSIIVFDNYRLAPKLVKDIRVGDLVAACLAIPNETSFTELNLAKLIREEAPKLAEDVWITGEGCRRIAVRFSEDPRLWRRVRRGAIPLTELLERGISPKEGWLRWRKSRLKIPVRIKVTPELCRLLGYYAAGGCITADTIQLSFGKHEQSYVNDAVDCAKKAFGCPVHIYEARYETFVRFGGKLLAALFQHVLGAGTNAATKAVPFLAFNVPDNMKLEFLRGYFRGDGGLFVNEERAKRILYAKTANRKLASDLVLLLLQMGVIPSVEHKESVRKGHRVGPTGQVIRGGSESFVVLIRDTGSLRRLGGVVADFSRDLAKRIASERGKTPSILALPAGLLAPLRGALRRGCKPVYKKELERFLQHGIYGLKRVSYRFLERLFDDMLEGVDDDRLRFVENLVRSKISLLPVKEIRKVEPSSRFVYDIEVLGLHTFVGGLGPILLHNTDGDPWGLHIAMVIISGSAEAAHIRELATPSAKWAGVWATDIVKYDLPTDPLTPIDIKRLYELRKDPRYRGKLWEREISTFLRIKRKAEQEAFCRYGLTYVVDTYLPEKIKLVV